MEQVVILVVIGLISLVNWIIQRSAELKKQRRLEQQASGSTEENPFQPRTEEPPRPAAPARDPSQEMRRLMEALGIPLEEEPPALPELPQAAPEPARPAVVEKVSPLPPAQVPVPVIAPPKPVARPARDVLSGALRSRDGLREAVVLREILGPPKAFTL